jgi:hypothetical protein
MFFMIFLFVLFKINLTPSPSPAERGAFTLRNAPLSAGEGLGVRLLVL